MKMYTYSVINLLILSTAWSYPDGTVFDNTKKCENGIIEKAITLTDQMRSEMAGLLPWFIHYSSYEGFTDRSKIDFLEDNIRVTPPKAKGGKNVEPHTISVKWEDLLTGTNSLDLELHIWKFEERNGVLGYYLCKTKGGKDEGKPHIGVAFTTGRGGGIPEETLGAARELKEEAEHTFNLAPGSFRTYNL